MLIIYQIKHKHTNNSYIGSTANLNNRIIRHKANCKSKYKNHFKLYQFINNNGGIEEFDITILSHIDFDICKKELLEQKYIDRLNPSLNERRAYQTIEQRKEFQKQYHRQYGNDLIECGCGSVLKSKHKYRHRKTKRHMDFLKKKEIIMTFD